MLSAPGRVFGNNRKCELLLCEDMDFSPGMESTHWHDWISQPIVTLSVISGHFTA